MKYRIVHIILFCFSLTILHAQTETNMENPFRKGSVLLFWGWNRTIYSDSDIRFKGADYDFQLNNVVAHDRPTAFKFNDYFNPLRVTIPQTNARIGYFIKDNLALVIALDHMKYVMDQDQTVEISGKVPVTYQTYVKNAQVDLSDKEFLTFEHTDGLNYINIGIEKYIPIIEEKKVDLYWAYGGGLGVLYPKTNAKLFGNERSDRFHTAGFGIDLRTNINLVLWKHSSKTRG